jgi:hypothetical protein
MGHRIEGIMEKRAKMNERKGGLNASIYVARNITRDFP